MSAVLSTLPALMDNGPLYRKTLETYNRHTTSYNNLKTWLNVNLAGKVGISLPPDGKMRVLSMGAGDGDVDSIVIPLLKNTCKPTELHATVVEPDVNFLTKYKDLVVKESSKFEGIKFDWRRRTFEEYMDFSGDGKFSFIGCTQCIYYLGDLDKTLPLMYNSLEEGGVLLVTMSTDTTGWGRMQQFLRTKIDRGSTYITHANVQEEVQKLGSKMESEVFESYMDISGVFEPPDKLTEDSNSLLNMITRTANFAEVTPEPLRSEVMEFLKSVSTPGKGRDGGLALDDGSIVIFIRRM